MNQLAYIFPVYRYMGLYVKSWSDIGYTKQVCLGSMLQSAV